MEKRFKKRLPRKRSLLDEQSAKRRKKKTVPSGSRPVEAHRAPRTTFRIIGRVGSGFLRAGLILGLLTIISMTFVCGYHYLLISPYIRLEEVAVDGVDGEIKDELIQMCGLNSELSLLALNLNELKQEMEKHPWIRSVRLERRFPHTLIVEAEKENPMAVIVMDRIYYMNRWGEAFKEVYEWEEMDFPVVTGTFKPGSNAQEQLNRAACIIRILESEEGLWSLKQVSEVHLEQDGGISLYFRHLPAEIRLASDIPAIASPIRIEDLGPDFKIKIDELKKLAKHLDQTGQIHQVNCIDLNYVNGAVVSFRKG
ncbi:MAG: FtsQ-type POTRA domain-containing protein [Thermodesulfobacteriota bacterium]|nr:FtsQ-type POTRA domain-containing protein [Thermodesulfobacteriota bacterium]